MLDLSLNKQDGSATFAPVEEHLAPAILSACLAAVPDEIDYGMILVTGLATVQYCNRAAQRELRTHSVLQVLEGRLCGRLASDDIAIHAAIQAAALRGARRMLALGSERETQTVAFVPITPSAPSGPAASAIGWRHESVLLLLGKRGICAPLSADGFSRQYGLTPAEANVLCALSKGLLPGNIARAHGVALSTVRTQMQSIRSKTGSRRIQEVISRMASLPPLVTCLRT